MKALVIISIFLIGLTTLNSCNKSKDDSMTICQNLSKQGDVGLSALVGEWNFESFAYAKNGKKIQNDNAIGKGYINITNTGSILFHHTNTIQYNFELYSSNDMRVKAGVYYTKMYSVEEEKITQAFDNCLCYIVKESKLYIHYTEKDGKNILILNKK